MRFLRRLAALVVSAQVLVAAPVIADKPDVPDQASEQAARYRVVQLNAKQGGDTAAALQQRIAGSHVVAQGTHHPRVGSSLGSVSFLAVPRARFAQLEGIVGAVPPFEQMNPFRPAVEVTSIPFYVSLDRGAPFLVRVPLAEFDLDRDLAPRRPLTARALARSARVEMAPADRARLLERGAKPIHFALYEGPNLGFDGGVLYQLSANRPLAPARPRASHAARQRRTLGARPRGR